MADIELVISMPEERYRHIMRMQFYTPKGSLIEEMLTTIRNGTPLPKGHGRLIDADVLKTAFPCGESIRTECVRSTINYAPTIIEADTESEGTNGKYRISN